jgi:hypothetical protein
MSEIKFCVSMSTIPSRIKSVYKTLDNIKKQNKQPEKIFLNIPYEYKRFKNEKINEQDIIDLKRDNLVISRCEDFGPGTKIMGSIEEVKKYDCVIIIDDDHLYDENIFSIFVEEFKKNKINYSFYLNKIFNIKIGQCADGFLINADLLSGISAFYEKYVRSNTNMFMDDDLWLAIFLQKEKKSEIKNLIEIFREKVKKNIVYTQHDSSKKNGLYLTVHKPGVFLNRRKIQKIELIKYLFKSLIN